MYSTFLDTCHCIIAIIIFHVLFPLFIPLRHNVHVVFILFSTISLSTSCNSIRMYLVKNVKSCTCGKQYVQVIFNSFSTCLYYFLKNRWLKTSQISFITSLCMTWYIFHVSNATVMESQFQNFIQNHVGQHIYWDSL